MEICWNAPPCSVYSKTDKSTMDSTVSRITNINTSPRKFKTQEDEVWEVVAKRTDAFKKVAEGMADAGETKQEEYATQSEVAKKQQEALKPMEKSSLKISLNSSSSWKISLET
eukprot:12696924-Ditylum_brightwellii.AAC.1